MIAVQTNFDCHTAQVWEYLNIFMPLTKVLQQECSGQPDVYLSNKLTEVCILFCSRVTAYYKSAAINIQVGMVLLIWISLGKISLSIKIWTLFRFCLYDFPWNILESVKLDFFSGQSLFLSKDKVLCWSSSFSYFYVIEYLLLLSATYWPPYLTKTVSSL